MQADHFLIQLRMPQLLSDRSLQLTKFSLEKLLEYIYTDDIDFNTLDNFDPIFEIMFYAERFQEERLIYILRKFCREKIKVESCFSFIKSHLKYPSVISLVEEVTNAGHIMRTNEKKVSK